MKHEYTVWTVSGICDVRATGVYSYHQALRGASVPPMLQHCVSTVSLWQWLCHVPLDLIFVYPLISA
jgi:hypothetical protein